ncbi:MAG: topoisomerase C-terminal repeat-containing protein, partial [Pseudomonadota bacterium]
DSIDLDLALKLLALPRLVGEHPETSTPIEARFGRYGPVLVYDGKFTPLETNEDVFEIGINRAVTVIAEKAASGGKGRFGAAAAKVLKDLGEHPDVGGKIEVMDGRYGPYVKHGKINATLPKDKEPTDLTVEDAVKLIADRAEKTGKKVGGAAKKKAPAKKAGAKKAAAKTATTKKAAAKKAPAKKKAAQKKKSASAAESDA